MAATAKTTANRIAARRPVLISTARERLSAAGLPPRAGPPSLQLDMAGHLDALVLALRSESIEEFAERSAWASVLGAALGGSEGALYAELRALREAMAAQLDSSSAAIASDYIDAARARLRWVPVVTPASLAVIPDAPAPPAHASPAAALDAAAERVAATAIVLGFMRRPASAIVYGEKRFRCLEDAGYHVAQLVAAVAENAPELFAEYAEWAQALLVDLGVDPHELTLHLGELSDTIAIVLPPPLADAPRRCVAAAIERLRLGAGPARSFVDPSMPHGALAERYLAMLLQMKRQDACRSILEAVEAGTTVRDAYGHVFQPCQYEIGRLWQTNTVSIAQEHYCTAVTQLCMSLLHPYVWSSARAGHRVLAACAGGNLHELGARFVSDFFEMAGWDTIYVGASTPTDHLVREVVAREIDVLAVSATLVGHVRAAREIVAAVRRHPACRDVVVLLGGYPFRVARDLWVRMGADGSAPDAESAVALGTKLIAARAA